MSTEDFDPYEQWLGISRHERPIDFYRLLGLERFESDAQRIAAAAEERMAYIRKFQTGPRGLFTQRLLNEFAAAKLRLLNPATKAEYDQRLRSSTEAAEQFAVAEDLALPEPALPDMATEHASAIPAAGQPVAVPPASHSFPAPSISVPKLSIQPVTRPLPKSKQSIVVPLAIVVVLAIIVLAFVFSMGDWFEKRQQDLPPDEQEQKLVGMGPKKTEPLPPGVVDQSASGHVQLNARTATIHGSSATLVNEGETGVIADWSAADDYLSWKFHLRKGAVFRIEVTYAVDGQPTEGRLQVRCDDQEKAWDLRDSGGLQSFVKDDQALVQVQEPGMHTLELRVADKPDDLVLNVKSVVLVPRRR